MLRKKGTKRYRRNNIIIYRIKQSAAASAELRRQHDFDTLVALLDNVFEVSYKDGDIKRVIRLGKKEEATDRPILVEFQSRMLKHYIMENLKKLGSADRKFKFLSITHDMTKKEREQCKFLVVSAKLKEQQEGQEDTFFGYEVPRPR